MDVEVSSKATEVEDLVRTNSDVRNALLELRQKYGLRALQEERFIPHSEVLKEIWVRLKLRLTKSQ